MHALRHRFVHLHLGGIPFGQREPGPIAGLFHGDAGGISVIRPLFRSGLLVEAKGDASPVTEADKARTPRMVAVDLVPWLTLQVTRHYRHPGRWVAQCPPILDTHILQADELEDAKVEAQELVRQHLAFALLKVSR